MAQPVAEVCHEGVRLIGFSQAGDETYVVAPEMNLALDVGRSPRDVLAMDHVFLTHGHMDHAAGVAYYCSQRQFIDATPGNLYAPQHLLDPLRRLLRIWADIDGHEPPAHLHAAEPGRDIRLRRDLSVRPFRVHHPGRGRHRTTVQALGFTVLEVRKKLKDEYVGLTGPQIVELKSKGVEIERRVELPLVAYTGDTGPGDFFDLDHVRNSKLLLVECTFVLPDHRERAKAGNHIHLDDLRDILPRLKNERILLTHLTRRTSLQEAREHLRRAFPDQAEERISFFMEHRRRRRPRRPAAGSPAQSC